MIRRIVPLLFAVAVLIAPLSPVPAAEPTTRPADAGKSEFIRFKPDGKGGGTLDTAIASYRNADGVVVHLVAAVHVGERSYFRGLSETFDTYDALLYELVKPKDAGPPGAREQAADEPAEAGLEVEAPRVRGGAAIGGIQTFMTNVLKLEFQLDSIDYSRPNFVHADLDVETFNAKQEERDESLFGLMLRSILSEMRRQRAGAPGAPAITIFDILAAMKSPDSARQYKLLLAPQFTHMEAQIAGIEGEEGSVLISERNKAALKVLEETMAKGTKSIGIFYGAGHMRGIEDALLGEMGFERIGVEWRVAWDMRTPARATSRPTTRGAK